MELRVLRYFLAVAREGSITAAANHLHLTQPTLSRQLRDLEDELGQKLFVRKSHRLELTNEGMLLRKRAEEIVSMVDKTEAEFSSMEGSVSGDVYIGGGETQAIRPVAELIRELRGAYPEIRFHLHSGNAEDVTERLDKGLLDFGILIQPADITKYDYLSLPDRDVWGVVMRRDCPLAAKEAVELDDLRGVPLIFSRQAISEHRSGNDFADWFGGDFGGARRGRYLQSGVQRGHAGGGRRRLRRDARRSGRHLRGQPAVLSPAAPEAGGGAGHSVEEVPGVLPGGRALSELPAGTVPSRVGRA